MDKHLKKVKIKTEFTHFSSATSEDKTTSNCYRSRVRSAPVLYLSLDF